MRELNHDPIRIAAPRERTSPHTAVEEQILRIQLQHVVRRPRNHKNDNHGTWRSRSAEGFLTFSCDTEADVENTEALLHRIFKSGTEWPL